MQCSKCGRKLKPDMTVCPSCGVGVNGQASIKEIKKRQAVKNSKNDKSGFEKISKLIIGILIAIGAVLVVGAAVFILTTNLRAYNAAQNYWDSQSYEQAENAYAELAANGYRDSEEKLKQLRTEWVNRRLDSYDYVGAQRYVRYLDEKLDYRADLFIKVTYSIAQLHEEKNPAIASYYYNQIHGHLDADERAAEMDKIAAQAGQTLDDFKDPEPSAEDEGKNLFYRVCLKSFDTEKEANDYKDVVAASGNSVSPFVDEVQGKWRVLAATQSDRMEAETRLLCLEKMGYEPELIVDWVKYDVGNADKLSSIMNDIAKAVSAA